MAEYAKQRSLKLLEYVCTMSFPFDSLIVQRIIELKHAAAEQDFWREIPYLLIQALIEMEMYIHKAIEELGRLDDAVKKLGESKKELVERFYLYKELRKTHKVDKEIFKIMFDRLPHQDKSFNKFYSRMKTWKSNHKELLEEEWDKIIFANQLVWTPFRVEQNDFHSFLEKLSSVGQVSSRKLNNLLQLAESSKYKNTKMFFYHIVTLLAACLIDRTKWAIKIYHDYVILLKKASLLTILLFPSRAAELSCIAEGQRMKALHCPRKTEQKADILRALAAIKIPCPLKDEPDFVARTNTFRRKEQQVIANTDVAEMTKAISLPYDKYFYDDIFINVLYTGKKIKCWNEILDLLKKYDNDLPNDFESILKKIFIVCKEKRNWKSPEELKYKQYFDRWENRGFFNTLHMLLDKKAIIRELNQIRWHKIPKSATASLTDSSSKPVIRFSPFWKK